MLKFIWYTIKSLTLSSVLLLLIAQFVEVGYHFLMLLLWIGVDTSVMVVYLEKGDWMKVTLGGVDE